MTYTGGELNELNGKMGISEPKKSVPIMKLIKAHAPKSKEALVDLIAYHKDNTCVCGVVSTGTVRDFGENLFKSQQSYWKKDKYTLEQCIQWEYDLFIVQSLKGGLMEKRAISLLKTTFKNLIIEATLGYLDAELRVDIIVYNLKKHILGGIQVKPKTFKNMRETVQLMQKKKNMKWGHAVWMLYYNKDESFENFDSLVEVIKKQMLNDEK